MESRFDMENIRIERVMPDILFSSLILFHLNNYNILYDPNRA